jgi:D-amino peptidase
MKVFVMTDMEGVSGICRSDQVTQGKPLYQEGRQFLTLDVNACVEGCFAGGADEVVVKDAHSGRGDNLLWEQLDPRAEYIMGETGRRRLPGIEECDALVLLGFHAMAGTPEAVLEHTMSSASWQNFWLNGRRTGEIGIDAAIAGENGVATVMLSGDDKACREAEQFIPGIVTACVKHGLCVEGGLLLSPERAHRLITERTAAAVQRVAEVEPYVVEPPITARLERVSRGRLPVRGEKPYVKIIDGRTYEVTADSVEQALWRL